LNHDCTSELDHAEHQEEKQGRNESELDGSSALSFYSAGPANPL